MKIQWSISLLFVMVGACSPPSAAPDAQTPPRDAQSSTMDAVAEDAQASSDAAASTMDALAEDAPPAVDAPSSFVDATEIYVPDSVCCVPKPDRNNPECVNLSFGLCISHHEGSACQWLCDGGR